MIQAPAPGGKAALGDRTVCQVLIRWRSFATPSPCRYPARALLSALMYFAVAVSERRIRKALRPKPGPGGRPVSR